MTEAQAYLREVLIDLWDQGYRPPYRLTITDGADQAIAFDVTMTIQFETQEPYERTGEGTCEPIICELDDRA